jgi:molybdate transport system substrate-binding protein
LASNVIVSILGWVALGSFHLLATTVHAAEIKVMISGGFSAYQELVSEYQRTTGNKVITSRGSSMGDAPNSIPSRLARGEPVDVVIASRGAFDDFIKQGTVVAGSRVDLARSRLGMAVRAGVSHPDISSVEAFRRAMLDARSVAYSASTSGRYFSSELFPRLGIADQMKAKSKMIGSEPVVTVVARGDAEVALAQSSELLPTPGIEFVAPLPPEIQMETVYSAAIAVGAKEPDTGMALIKFLAAQAAAHVITKYALEPISSIGLK